MWIKKHTRAQRKYNFLHVILKVARTLIFIRKNCFISICHRNTFLWTNEAFHVLSKYLSRVTVWDCHVTFLASLLKSKSWERFKINERWNTLSSSKESKKNMKPNKANHDKSILLVVFTCILFELYCFFFMFLERFFWDFFTVDNSFILTKKLTFSPSLHWRMEIMKLCRCSIVKFQWKSHDYKLLFMLLFFVE